MKELPIGVQTFDKIIAGGYMYVDKTGYVYEIANKFEYVFLSRPRRFGKSLLSSTFHSYFAGERELFDGLEAGKLETEWVKHPVFHFDMSTAKHMNEEQLLGELDRKLGAYEQIYGRGEKDIRVNQRLEGLVQRSVERTGEKAVIIIDEYDAPLLDVMNDKQKLVPMRQIRRNFYSPIKSLDPYLRFVFITGINKFAQLSIFSELNNLKNISMLPEFSAVCGISQSELERVFPEQIEALAKAEGVSGERALELLKENYDGYHFSENSQDVYAPYSLLNALNDKATRHYWFESGTSASLIEHLKHFPGFNPLDFDGVELSLEEFNVPCENASTPVPMLYQSGYLTIDYYNKEDDVYVLHFPNYEVRQGIVYSLTNYLMDISDWDRNATILAMARALKRGDLPAALTELRSYIASLPYDIITRKEWMAKKKKEAFYKLLMYVVFSLLNSKVDTEVKSVLGRADVVIKTRNDIYVLELKVDDTVDHALAQIDSKGYAIPYEADGRTVTKCGVAISSETRNIVHWRAVDKDGEVIDEQSF